MAERQACAVCGQGGYWVGFSGRWGEDRCVNHLETQKAEPTERRFFASGEEAMHGTPQWNIAPIRHLDGAPFWRDTQSTDSEPR